MSDLAHRQAPPAADVPTSGESFSVESPSCSAPPTWSEAERLAALDRYAILDTGRETAFDDVAALAADLLDAPIAVVNLIAADRQWFKAEVGIGADTLPLDVSICRHAILQPGVFIVPDLTRDARFDGNPLIHVADGLRFYAGALLETPDGLPLGTVCVLDTKSRPEGLSERQTRALKVLAAQTMARLELRRSEAIARDERARAERHARRLSLLAQASSLLLASNDPASAVRELFDVVAQGFRLDVGFHYRCGEPGLQLVAAAGLTPTQERAAARIEFGQTVCGIVAATLEPTHVTGIQTSEDPHVQFLKMLGLDTYFSAPLLSGGDLLGTLSFGRKDDPFSTGELEALGALVAQLATALERRRAEVELRETADRLQLATENAEVGFWDVDPLNDVLVWPRRTKAMFGISPDAPVSMQDFYEGLHPDDQEATSIAYAAAADPQERALYDVEYRTVGKEDGQIRWVAAKGRGVFDEAGECTRVIGTAIDVTARKRSEDELRELNETLEARVEARTAELETAHQQLRQSQKLEAIGQLTGGVAHDFNNLLTVIRGSVELLKRPDLTPERRERYLNAVGDTADRAAGLTQQLLAFARRQALKAEPFDIGASVCELTPILSTLVGSRVEMELKSPSQPIYALADRGQFDTAVVNMALNARDAMESAGRLVIAARAVSGIPALRAQPPQAGDFIAVTVTDTGSGISPDQLDRIFEPFYTTKAIGAGTGLGLSQVFGFAKQSGGDLRVDSTQGEGATFTLYLPRAYPGGDRASAPQDVERAETGDGVCVLVVEDNQSVGTFATDALTTLGYECVLAADGEKALATLEANPARFQVVFSDVVMPGMGGLELKAAIRERFPDMPVILTSGYSHVLAQSGDHDFELLHKPYTIGGLSHVIRKALLGGSNDADPRKPAASCGDPSGSVSAIQESDV